MLNERGYERETNCSGMLRTSSKLLRAKRVHHACRICIHTNELVVEKSFYGLFPTLYYRFTLNDYFVFFIGVWY